MICRWYKTNIWQTVGSQCSSEYDLWSVITVKSVSSSVDWHMFFHMLKEQFDADDPESRNQSIRNQYNWIIIHYITFHVILFSWACPHRKWLVKPICSLRNIWQKNTFLCEQSWKYLRHEETETSTWNLMKIVNQIVLMITFKSERRAGLLCFSRSHDIRYIFLLETSVTCIELFGEEKKQLTGLQSVGMELFKMKWKCLVLQVIQ